MADKKRDILEFVEQMNFEQMIPTQKIDSLRGSARFFGVKRFCVEKKVDKQCSKF
jgi:hypothetical protein